MALANLFAFMVTMTNIATVSLAAAQLAPASLATLPVAVMTIATALAAMPLSQAMQRHGRRRLFIVAALIGSLGAGLMLFALYERLFGVLVLGAALLGVYVASAGFYRYAAAEAVEPEAAPRAISWVLAAGMAAALITPAADAFANRALEPVTFAGAFLVMVLAPLLALIPLSVTPLAPCCAANEGARPMSRRQAWQLVKADPVLLLGVLGAASAAVVMTLLMNATPLAMQGCGFSPGQSAGVVQVHVVAMFAPAFLTGEIISRLGLPRTIAAGLLLLAAAAVVAVSGLSLGHFGASLVLLGLGWNLLFTAGTTLVAQASTPETRAGIQGLNETLVFGAGALAAASAGPLLSFAGWPVVSALGLALLAPTAALAWRLRTQLQPV
jgi:MFS family permease